MEENACLTHGPTSTIHRVYFTRAPKCRLFIGAEEKVKDGVGVPPIVIMVSQVPDKGIVEMACAVDMLYICFDLYWLVARHKSEANNNRASWLAGWPAIRHINPAVGP